MMIKKRFLIIVLFAIFITSCSEIEISSKQKEFPENITKLQKAVELSPEDTALKHQLGLMLYEHYLEQARLKKVSEENLPFLFYNEKNTEGCLLIHGFTATPWELRELGKHLFSRNITVYGVLLEGHGTSPKELDKTRWQDWYESSEEGLDLLSYLVDNVYVCGQSAGASLAIKLAEENDIKGIVSIVSPIYLKDERANLAFLLAPFNLYFKNKNLKEEDKNYYYEIRSAKSIAELVKLIREQKKILNKITHPILIIQSRNDTRIETESAEYIYDKIGSSNKGVLLVDEPEHVLVTGDNNEGIFESITNFIKETK